MTNEMMIKTVKDELQSVSGYRYNPQVIEDVIASREIPDGATVFADGSMKIVRKGDVCVATDKDGNSLGEQPLSNNDFFEQALMMYAKKMAVK